MASIFDYQISECVLDFLLLRKTNFLVTLGLMRREVTLGLIVRITILIPAMLFKTHYLSTKRILQAIRKDYTRTKFGGFLSFLNYYSKAKRHDLDMIYWRLAGRLPHYCLIVKRN